MESSPRTFVVETKKRLLKGRQVKAFHGWHGHASFYKALNAEETHFGLEFHPGENIDPCEFDKNPSSDGERGGGIHFVCRKDVWVWRDFEIKVEHEIIQRICPYVRQVTFDDDEDIWVEEGLFS